MKFTQTTLQGVWLVDQERHHDERGWFARSWCQREFCEHGLDDRLVQCSISHNRLQGTLRGMHYSVPPHAEDKVIRCVRGAIYDVALDVRPGSPTFGRWISETLTAENGRAIYIPAGVAHGFQTLEDHSDVLYQMSVFFDPACARGLRWDDPAFNVAWPSVAERVMSQRDREYPEYGS